MPKVSVRELGVRDSLTDDGDDYYSITLKIEGKLRKFRCRTMSLERALELAYFYWTGKVIDWQLDMGGGAVPIFTDIAADPDGFTDLDKVPRFLTLPF